MPRYRTAFLIGALATVLLVTPALARDFRAALAKTDAAESAASIHRNLARFGHWTLAALGIARSTEPHPAADARPLTVDDFERFTGEWNGHGRMLTVNTDGTATYSARTYQWCHDTGVRPPCDAIRDGIITHGIEARLIFVRVDGRTAHGFIVWLGDPAKPGPEPVSLTEGEHGIGYLLAGDTAAGPTTAPRGISVCRERVLDDAPPSVGRLPCGA